MTDEAKQKLIDDAQSKVDRLTQELSAAANELETAKGNAKIGDQDAAEARKKSDKAKETTKK